MPPRRSYSTKGLKPIEFEIDGDVFKCHPRIPADDAIQDHEIPEWVNETRQKAAEARELLVKLEAEAEANPNAEMTPDEVLKVAEVQALTAQVSKYRDERLVEFFEKVLLPESWKRFKARMAKDIDLPMMAEIRQDLLEEYANRPTQPSSLSSGSSSKTKSGAASTGGRPRKASTRSTSR